MGSSSPASERVAAIALAFLTLGTLLCPSTLSAAESRLDPAARPELTLLDAHRFRSVGLGPRTLRVDTACTALLALAHASLETTRQTPTVLGL